MEVTKFLECVLLLKDDVSQFELMTKYGMEVKMVIEAKRILDIITNI